MGRVADTARSLCAAGPYRAVALSTAVTSGHRARTLAQHREPRVTTARRPEAHLPQRLRGATLEGQGAADLRADRARLQRPATAEDGPPQRRCRGCPGLARRRPVAALSAPATAGERMVAADATDATDATAAAHATDATCPPRCRRRMGRRRGGGTARQGGHQFRRCRSTETVRCRGTESLRCRRRKWCGRLRGGCRCRVPRRAARAARSDPRGDRQAASRDLGRSATRSTPQRGRRASRGRSTRPNRDRRGAG